MISILSLLRYGYYARANLYKVFGLAQDQFQTFSQITIMIQVSRLNITRVIYISNVFPDTPNIADGTNVLFITANPIGSISLCRVFLSTCSST